MNVRPPLTRNYKEQVRTFFPIWFHYWRWIGWAKEQASIRCEKPVSILALLQHYLWSPLPPLLLLNLQSPSSFQSNHPDSVKAADDGKMQDEERQTRQKYVATVRIVAHSFTKSLGSICDVSWPTVLSRTHPFDHYVAT